MNRLQQNIIYACLIIAIGGFFWAIYPKNNYVPHGIYLPQIKTSLPQLEPKQVGFYGANGVDTQKAVPIVDNIRQSPIGIIRTVTHFKDFSQIKSLCGQSALKARKLAAAHGAGTVIGYCFASRDKGPLDGVRLYAYAYP